MHIETRHCRSMASRRLVLAAFTLLVASSTLQSCRGSSSSDKNATRGILDEDEDEVLSSDMDIVAFKERYRRLIPYMTYYFGNNYIGSQASTPPSYERSPPPSNYLIRRPQYTLIGPDDTPRKAGPNYQGSLSNQEEKFVPSVQYDPKDVGSNNNYFTPVRYNAKANYEDYSVPLYRPYQKQRPIYTQVTTTAGIQDDQFFTTVRPSRPYGLSSQRDYLPRKPPIKSINPNVQRDYLLDFITRPSGKLMAVNNEFKYPVAFEPVRYAKPESTRLSQPFRLSEPSVLRQPSALLNLPRNPNVNLNHITKSLQLTNRLPEMLNTNNIDNSIRTLVEILGILNSAKKNEPSVQQIPAPPKAAQRYPNYIEFKAQSTGSKIPPGVKYQTTLAPLVVPAKPTQYKSESPYVTNIELNAPPEADYYPGDAKEPEIIEYYTPLTQDIDVEDKERFVSTIKPQQGVEETTKHSYEITEDLRDDVLQDQKFILPLTTELPIRDYPRPDGVSSHAQIIPPNVLKNGATRGKPNIDYPAYSTIPETDFSCKNQRYKGFFGDPATGCQVWHYCDLNGGKSSFLCPNGTIFNQVALTCDWWFNVKCESTTQLYVLNERLYKFILPLMPKFPEDFTGPEVDRYLELKFKEMEAKLKEKKVKKQQEEKKKDENELISAANAEIIPIN